MVAALPRSASVRTFGHGGGCPKGGVTYSVHFLPDLEPFPELVRAELQRTMEQVALAVETIEKANPFWSSIRSSVLHIDVSGFRLSYRICPHSSEIHVTEITPLPRSA